MFEDFSVKLDGRLYTLDYEQQPSLGISAPWDWSDQHDMAAPRSVKPSLDRLFLELWDATSVQAASQNQFEALCQLLPAMGADAETLKQLGLKARTPEETAEIEREDRLAILPAAGHSPVNCADLFRWFCDVQCGVDVSGQLIGEGPFEKSAFLQMTRQCGVLCFADEEEATSAFLTFLADKPTGVPMPIKPAYVVGRDDWSQEVLDELIDSHDGKELRIYSQEMFVSWMLTGKDPFDGGIDVLAAFRIGHPALEYLSQGWPGWVTSMVSPDRGRHVPPEQIEISRDKGLLAYMGYKVGKTGEAEPTRHQILQEVFCLDLTDFHEISDVAYLQEWGSPRSGDRLHKMANSIATFCRNQRQKNNASAEAIADWEADLTWLRTTYYKGVMRFCWPHTDVT